MTEIVVWLRHLFLLSVSSPFNLTKNLIAVDAVFVPHDKPDHFGKRPVIEIMGR
jgi:hypothetical protein